VRLAYLAAVVLATGCSLQSAGTAEPIELLDDASTDTTVERDTLFPANDTATEDAQLDTIAEDAQLDAAPEVIDVGTCPAGKAGAKPCDEIPHLEGLATAQVMDGAPDDFCGIPYVDFDNSKGAIRDPASITGPAQTTMRIRVAWSSFGLHAHLAVKDDSLLPHKPLTDDRVYLGDSVEIYVAGHDMMTGAFDGATKDFGAQQIIFTAPDTTTMSRAVYFYGGTPKSSPDINRWKARLTSAGYEIELRLPWGELKHSSMMTPSTGSRIALTWAFNNKYNTTDPQAFSVFQVKTPYPTVTPCPGTAQPFCDDRLWCTPALL